MPGLNTTPLPKLDLINAKYYSSMAIQYSRGCPFNCEFCDIIEIYGRKPRMKSPAQMVAELELLYARKWRGPVFIVDDNFIGNKRKVKELLPVMAEWNTRHGRPFQFYTEASVNLADDQELLQMMQNANFDRVFLGIETPAEESLKEAQKMQNTHRSLLESVKRIQRYGMEVMARDWLIHNPRGLSTVLFLGLRRLLGSHADLPIRGLLSLFAAIGKLPSRRFTGCFLAVCARKPHTRSDS